MKIHKITIMLLLMIGFGLLSQRADAQWVKSGRSAAISLTNDQDIDASGDVYSVGVLTCNTIFETDTLRNNTCGENDTIPVIGAQIDGFIVRHNPSGDLMWSKQLFGVFNNELSVNALTVDNTGISYTVGQFKDTLVVGLGPADTLFNNDTTHAFLLKVLPDGTTDWSRQIGGGDTATVFLNDIDLTNNQLVSTGKFVGGLMFGPDVDSLESENFFIASFDDSGTELWMRNITPLTPGSTSVGKAIVAQGDSILAVAEFSGSVSLDGQTLMVPGGGTEGSVLMSYDLAGNLQWFRVLNTIGVQDVALTFTDSTIYLTGASTGITVIDTDTLFFDAGTKGFLSSHRIGGRLKWALPITSGGSQIPSGNSISINPQDNVFIAGAFFGANVTIGAMSATGNNDLNGFAAKLDSAGAVTWVQNLGGVGTESASVISAFDEDTIYVGGFFSRYIRVGGEEIQKTSNGNNAYIARLDICPEVEVEMLTADVVERCDGETLTIQVTNNATYSYTWYKNDTLISTAPDAPTYTTGGEGDYYAVIDNGLACIKRTPSSFLIVNPLPPSDVDPTGPIRLCAGDSVTLSSPRGSFTWQWLESGVDIPTETLSQTKVKTNGDYQVRVGNQFNCNSTSPIVNVTFFDYPDNSLSPLGRFVICGGEMVPITADGGTGFTYQWFRDEVSIDGATAQTYNATTTGEYMAIVKNQIGCATETLTDTVVVQTAPIIALNDDTISPILCNGDSVKIITSGVLGQFYQWRRNGIDIPGAIENSITVKTGGDYTVFVQNASCDDVSDIVSLALVDPPPAIINNMDQIICEGEELMLEANDGVGFTYQWRRNDVEISGATNRIYEANISGVYSVKVFNSSGCNTLSQDVLITVNLSPPSSISPQGNSTVCNGDEVILRANAGTGLTYQWFRDGNLLNSQVGLEYTATISGDYTVKVTNVNLCDSLSEIQTINVIEIPQATITKIGQSDICVGDSLQLQGTVDPTYEYQWLSSGALIPDAIESFIYVKEPGAYQSVVYIGDCRDTSQVLDIGFVANPKPQLVRNADFLSISLFGDIQWFLDGQAISGANSQNIQVVEDGFYMVRVINENGCTAISDSLSVCIPIAELSRFEDQLTVNLEFEDYEWYFGENLIQGASSRTLIAQQSGMYSAVITNSNGCRMRTDEIEVCVPFPFITQDDDTGILMANPDVANAYQWYYDSIPLIDEDLNVLIPDTAGLYKVEVLDFENCLSISEAFEIFVVTGLDINDVKEIDIYPNPFDNQVFIYSKLNEKIDNIKIFDAGGKEVINIKSSPQSEIDVSGLRSGTYYLVMLVDGKVYYKKLVKP